MDAAVVAVTALLLAVDRTGAAWHVGLQHPRGVDAVADIAERRVRRPQTDTTGVATSDAKCMTSESIDTTQSS